MNRSTTFKPGGLPETLDGAVDGAATGGERMPADSCCAQRRHPCRHSTSIARERSIGGIRSETRPYGRRCAARPNAAFGRIRSAAGPWPPLRSLLKIQNNPIPAVGADPPGTPPKRCAGRVFSARFSGGTPRRHAPSRSSFHRRQTRPNRPEYRAAQNSSAVPDLPGREKNLFAPRASRAICPNNSRNPADGRKTEIWRQT